MVADIHGSQSSGEIDDSTSLKMRDHARQIGDPAENSLRVGAARGRQVALEISDLALCARSRRRWRRHETRPRPMRDRVRRRSPCRKAVSPPCRGPASLTSRQLVTPRSEALQCAAGRAASNERRRVKSPLALLAISAAPTDGWTTVAFTPARVFVPTAPAWLRVSDLGSGPERRERGSHSRSSRNPRYSVGRPTFFGHTAGVWSPTPTPLPCARHAGHGQASLRMATGDRDARPARKTAGHGGLPIPALPAVPPAGVRSARLHRPRGGCDRVPRVWTQCETAHPRSWR